MGETEREERKKGNGEGGKGREGEEMQHTLEDGCSFVA